ncbi:MAG: FliA/WhiG family RNA polymerase sigma factor [Bryobacterales bacterium]|nr:FliA/WhiG family RNA polymerase sigma factor [Bryobacterales bacterium]
MAVHCIAPARGEETPIPVPVNRTSSTSPTLARSESQAIRDQRILENLHLARIIAIRIYEGLPIHLELEELIQVGTLGLIDAAARFDESKNVSFPGYAKHRIRGAILDSLRDMDWASRDQRRRCKQVDTATRKLSGILQRTPTDAEIAQEMGLALEKWQQVAGSLRNHGPVSAASRPLGQDDLPEPEFPADEADHPDAICRRNQIAEALKEAILALPIRYQTVVSMYYTDEMTMKEIGSVLGVNESRVSQIHKSALQKMAVVLETNGISAAAVL